MDGLADHFAQLFEGLVISQVLGKLIVQLRQFLPTNTFHLRVEADGLAGKLLLTVVCRIADIEIPLLARRRAAQTVAKPLYRIRRADLDHDLVLLDWLALDAARSH